MQAFPNVKVEYGEAPFGNDLETKLNAAFATGTAPDVIGHSIASIAGRSDKGQYTPLDDYIAKWDGREDYLANGFKLGTYKGKLMGLAYYAEPNFFAFRKDYFQEAGLDPAKPPRTWEQLADYAQKLTKRDGDVVTRSGMNIPYNDLRLVQAFLYQNDYHPFDADGKPTWNSKEFVDTIAFMTDMYKNRKVAMQITMVANDQQNLFTVDKAAMGIIKPSQYKAMVNRDPSYKEKVGGFELTGKKEAGFCGAEFLFINSGSKLKDAAWNLIAWAQTKDETWNRYQKTSIPVMRKSLMDAYSKDNPINRSVLKAIEIGDGAPRIWWSTTYLFNYVAVIMEESLFGKKAPEQSVKDNYELFLKELERMK